MRRDDTRVVCKVSGAYNSWSDIDRVYPYAAPGSKPGDSGTVRFSFTTEKGKKLSARTRVIVGEPVVKVRTTKVFKDVGPGSVLSTPVVVRNTGEVPVRGVGLQLSVGTGLRFKQQYGNCRYPGAQKGSLAVCELEVLQLDLHALVAVEAEFLGQRGREVHQHRLAADGDADAGMGAVLSWRTGRAQRERQAEQCHRAAERPLPPAAPLGCLHASPHVCPRWGGQPFHRNSQRSTRDTPALTTTTTAASTVIPANTPVVSKVPSA